MVISMLVVIPRTDPSQKTKLTTPVWALPHPRLHGLSSAGLTAWHWAYSNATRVRGSATADDVLYDPYVYAHMVVRTSVSRLYRSPTRIEFDVPSPIPASVSAGNFSDGPAASTCSGPFHLAGMLYGEKFDDCTTRSYHPRVSLAPDMARYDPNRYCTPVPGPVSGDPIPFRFGSDGQAWTDTNVSRNCW